MTRMRSLIAAVLLITPAAHAASLELQPDDHLCLIGNTLAERMQHDGWLETIWQSRFRDQRLVVRNLGFSGDELTTQLRSLNFGTADEWLFRCQATVVLAFFGYNESFAGGRGLATFRHDLKNYLSHLREQRFNAQVPPRLVLVSPIPHEDLHDPHLPDGSENNARIERYVEAMRTIAAELDIPFVDLFHPMQAEYARATEPLTINGIHLTDEGNRLVAQQIDRQLFGEPTPAYDFVAMEPLRRAVQEKNFHWFHRYRTTDGYSIFGGRADLAFTDGQTNRDVAQREMEVLDVMTANRDRHIWSVAQGRDEPVQDDNTPPFLPVVTNHPGPLPGGKHIFLTEEQSIQQMTVHPEMQVQLFASEEQFPELVSPVQMAFDTHGRLWVAVWPSYPHWKPKEEMNDKLLCFSDTDGDGRADAMQVFADGLHNPTGFEFWGRGVYVAQAPDLLYLEDSDGDGKADIRRRVLHGLDSADTHHTANSFTLGPGGTLYFQEGTFHHTQVETPWRRPVRSANAAVFQWEPRTFKFDVYIAYPFANPHGHVFDAWGQDFVTDGTGNENYFASPFSGHMEYPQKHSGYFPFFQQRIRPCGGTEILSSRAFPPHFQGNYLNANVIGFQGILQYEIDDDGSGFQAKEVEPIVFSSDPNFRPVDIEMGPDGAIYFLDWQNPIIGHMQHNLRDPNRDRDHGRVYRVSHRDAPASPPVAIAGQPLAHLLDLLREPENRVRHRVRIELSRHNSQEVIAATGRWLEGLDRSDLNYEHHRLEGLWVHQQHDQVEPDLLADVLASSDPRARAAAIRVLCSWRDRLPEPLEQLRQLARDPSPRVRLEAVRACSFFSGAEAVEVALSVLQYPMDRFLEYCLNETVRALQPYWLPSLQWGQPILTDQPAALDYLVQRIATPDLILFPRSPAICRELLSREAILPEHRLAALQDQARYQSTDIAREWIATIQRLDRRKDGPAVSVLGDMAHLMHVSPEIAQSLREDRASRQALEELARNGQSASARQTALAAVADVEPDPAATWRLATTSPPMLFDLLNAIPQIISKQVRSDLQPRVLAFLDDISRANSPSNRDEALQQGQHGRVVLPSLSLSLTAAEVPQFEKAAIVALPYTEGNSQEVHRRLGEYVVADRHRTQAIQGLRRIPRRDWHDHSVEPVLVNVISHLEALSAEERTEPQAIDELNLARTLAGSFPLGQGNAFQERLRELGVNIIAIRPVPHMMIFDRTDLYVEAGRPVQILFENTDIMPHNFLIAMPGTLLEVGLAADAMATRPDGYARQFVPDHPAVLHATKLLQAGQAERLNFNAPTELGDYPFVCTFPGHWRRMYGTLHVVSNLDEVPASALAAATEVCSPVRAYVRNWTLEELAPLVAEATPSASWDRGKVLFTELTCDKCHAADQDAVNVGPSLLDIAGRIGTGEITRGEILNQILNPSSKIDPKYATTTVLDQDGRVHSGIVQASDAQQLVLIPSPLERETLITIPREQIDEEHPSDVSLMPQGLLSTAFAPEIADLLLFIESGGKLIEGQRK